MTSLRVGYIHHRRWTAGSVHCSPRGTARRGRRFAFSFCGSLFEGGWREGGPHGGSAKLRPVWELGDQIEHEFGGVASDAAAFRLGAEGQCRPASGASERVQQLRDHQRADENKTSRSCQAKKAKWQQRGLEEEAAFRARLRNPTTRSVSNVPRRLRAISLGTNITVQNWSRESLKGTVMIDFPHSEEGSRKLLNRAAVVALILLVGAWFAFSWFQGSKQHLATPSTGSGVGNAVPAQSQSTSIAAQENSEGGEAAKQNPVAQEVAKQNAGGEEVAKQNPAGGGEAAKQNPGIEEHASDAHASVINTSKPINIDDAQRATLRAIFASGHPPTVERPYFELMIGASVAEQTPLADLPPEVPKALNGFSGDKYVIAGDELVIVDQHSRRVAAIIGGVK